MIVHLCESWVRAEMHDVTARDGYARLGKQSRIEEGAIPSLCYTAL